MIFKSLSDLATDIQLKLLPTLPRDISVVYGIPRSGMIPASILATALGAELGMLGGESAFGARRMYSVWRPGGKVLLVDDSIHTGKAMRCAREMLATNALYTCAIYAHSRSVTLVDFYAEVLDQGRIFQWNFAGIKATANYCWDLDGVICTDPTVPDADSDGYACELLYGVRPLYLPQVMVKAIVTDRLERWRPETTTWLSKNGVQYQHLVMQPTATSAPWSGAGLLGAFKAHHLVALDGTVFVESHDNVASEISRLARRPVLSVESMRLFGA